MRKREDYFFKKLTSTEKSIILYGTLDKSLEAWRIELPQHRKHLWDQFGAELTVLWIETRPCSRPYDWWTFAAPEPREILTGIYTVADTFYKQSFCLGLPVLFFEIKGPVTCESQAAYLKRLQLLTKAEKMFLSQHKSFSKPDDLQKVFVSVGVSPQVVYNPSKIAA